MTTNTDPWEPANGDVDWMFDPQKRANHVRLLEAHNESLYRDAVAFIQCWRGEIEGDSRANRSAA
jgi:hypothetical protein